VNHRLTKPDTFFERGRICESAF